MVLYFQIYKHLEVTTGHIGWVSNAFKWYMGDTRDGIRAFLPCYVWARGCTNIFISRV